jgi:hypothetical protein
VLEEELRDQAGGERFYFFNSFFYKKLSEKTGARAGTQEHNALAYERVKKWTKVGGGARGGGVNRVVRGACRVARGVRGVSRRAADVTDQVTPGPTIDTLTKASATHVQTTDAND